MCRHRSDLGVAHPGPGHSGCPSYPRSGDHDPARSRSIAFYFHSFTRPLVVSLFQQTPHLSIFIFKSLK